jgi:hypothetical protein
LAAAKAITTGYVASGRVSKTADGNGGVLTDDDGHSDLAKTQLVGWTVIGAIVYLVGVFHADPTKGLPDIDGALMVLLGLGHGAYIGKKLVTTDTPQILSLTALTRPGQSVVITGSGFGTQVGTVLIDDHALVGASLQWEDTKITFTLSPTHPNGSAWREGQIVTVAVNAGGQSAANPQPLVVALAPRPVSLRPTSTKPGSTVAIVGQLLAGTSTTVSIDGTQATVTNATDTEVQFTVPVTSAPKNGAPVLVTVDGHGSPIPLFLDVT